MFFDEKRHSRSSARERRGHPHGGLAESPLRSENSWSASARKAFSKRFARLPASGARTTALGQRRWRGAWRSWLHVVQISQRPALSRQWVFIVHNTP